MLRAESVKSLTGQLQAIVESETKYTAYTKDIVRVLGDSIDRLSVLSDNSDLIELSLIATQMHFAIRTFQIVFVNMYLEPSVYIGLRKIIDVVDDLDLQIIKRQSDETTDGTKIV
jgi:hypothetical protein